MNNIILVGCPNVGKTTLFNTLTKSSEKASNWHGVTVSEKCKKIKFDESEFSVTDLPGMYSLNGFSNEEKIASKYLEKHGGDTVVCVIDANQIKRNLRLAVELINKGLNVVVAVNMFNEVKLKNEEKLSQILGVKTIYIDARKKKSAEKIFECAEELSRDNSTSKNAKKLLNSDVFIKIDDFLKQNADLNSYKLTDKIDNILLNKFVFVPAFLSVLFLIFYLTFGPAGSLLSAGVNYLLEKIFGVFASFISSLNMSFVLKSFFIDGLLASISSVCSFIPQILLLMFFINFLEDIGFMSRVAFMFDGSLKKFGLTGKSIFSLMMGYGCTTAAIMTTRNLESEHLRKRTALLLPFSTCSAKLPVFLVISSLFFEKQKYLFVFALYLFAIFVMLVCACFYKKFIPEKQETFVMEMPKFRLPYFKKIVKDSLQILADFAIKVGTLILFFSSILWVLQNFSVGFDYLQGSNFEKSILYFLSSKISVLFSPIGLGSAGIIAALLLGLVAKELVVVGLALINGVGITGTTLAESLLLETSVCHFTKTSSIIFLVFILLYAPCISALGTIKSELGTKTFLYVLFFQFALSYAMCLLLYSLISIPVLAIVLVALTLFAFLTCVMLKLYRKKKSCRGNCSACRKV